MDPEKENQSDESVTSEGITSRPPLPESIPTPQTPTSPAPRRAHRPNPDSPRKTKGPQYKNPPQKAPGSDAPGSDAPQADQVKRSTKLLQGSTSPKPLLSKPAYTAAQKKDMVKKAAPYLQMASAFVAAQIIKDPVELENQIFVMSEAESKAIVTPAVSIMARHQIGADALGDNDLSDAIAMGVALVAYVGAGFKDRKILKEMRQGQPLESYQDAAEEVRSSPSTPTAPQNLIQDTLDLAQAEEAASLSQMNYLKRFLPQGLQ